MLKKLSIILTIVIVIAMFPVNAFAGKTDGVGNSTSPAISRPNSRNTSTSQSAVNKADNSTSAGAIEKIADKNGRSDAVAYVSDEEFEKALKKALRNGVAIDNGEFIIEITSPDKDKDSTYKKTYILSGRSKVAGVTDIIIAIAKYNEEKGEYEPMYNTDGESSWEIGSTGVFSKEILLTRGTNKIKILSYRTSQKDPSKIQINCFTIELLDEAIAERAKKPSVDITGISRGEGLLSKLFGGKSK